MDQIWSSMEFQQFVSIDDGRQAIFAEVIYVIRNGRLISIRMIVRRCGRASRAL